MFPESEGEVESRLLLLQGKLSGQGGDSQPAEGRETGANRGLHMVEGEVVLDGPNLLNQERSSGEHFRKGEERLQEIMNHHYRKCHFLFLSSWNPRPPTKPQNLNQALCSYSC